MHLGGAGGRKRHPDVRHSFNILRSSGSVLDVELCVGSVGLQHQLVQLPHLLVLELAQLLLRQGGAELHRGPSLLGRVQHLRLEGVPVALREGGGGITPTTFRLMTKHIFTLL